MFFRFFERLFVAVLLLGSMQVTVGLTSRSLGDADPSVVSTDLHMSSVITDGIVYGCGFLLILGRWQRVFRAIRAVWPLVGLTALAPLSILWSAQPILTLRRSALLLVSTLFAVYLGERYTMEKLARLLAQTLCFMMIVIIAVSFVSPEYVIDYSSHMGAWKGFSIHKNDFGGYMAITVLLLSLVRYRHFYWLRYLFLVVAVVLLFLSRSAGAVFCCALMVAAVPLWRWARLNRKQQLLLCIMSVLLFSGGMYFIATHTDLLFQMLGRDSTLTGRTHLWATVWPAIAKHPILGYGYDAFWAGLTGEALDARIKLRWLASAADNGYIDLCLSLGFGGVVAFVGLVAQAFRMGIGYIKSEPGPLGLWPITYLCFYLVHNLCESDILRRGALPFLLFAMIVTSLAVNHPSALSANRTAGAQ